MLRPREKDLTSLKEKVEHKRAQAKQSMGMRASYIRHIVVSKYDKSICSDFLAESLVIRELLG